MNEDVLPNDLTGFKDTLVWNKLYNFQADEKSRKPNGTVEYEVIKNGNNKRIFDFTEELASIEGASPYQTTIEKLLPLQNLEPGAYTLKMKVTDRNRNVSLTPEATFTVE